MEVKRMAKQIGLILSEIEIRAILARRQVQLRRLRPVAVAAGDVIWGKEWYHPSLHEDGYDEDESELVHDCPAYRATSTYRCGKPMVYDLEDTTRPGFWTAAYLMPPSLSRLRLRVESRWMEYLHTADWKAAGAESRDLFAANWDQEHRSRLAQFATNPMVLVIQFTLEEL
jgi:hypothetical protein